MERESILAETGKCLRVFGRTASGTGRGGYGKEEMSLRAYGLTISLSVKCEVMPNRYFMTIRAFYKVDSNQSLSYAEARVERSLFSTIAAARPVLVGAEPEPAQQRYPIIPQHPLPADPILAAPRTAQDQA